MNTNIKQTEPTSRKMLSPEARHNSEELISLNTKFTLSLSNGLALFRPNFEMREAALFICAMCACVGLFSEKKRGESSNQNAVEALGMLDEAFRSNSPDLLEEYQKKALLPSSDGIAQLTHAEREQFTIQPFAKLAQDIRNVLIEHVRRGLLNVEEAKQEYESSIKEYPYYSIDRFQFKRELRVAYGRGLGERLIEFFGEKNEVQRRWSISMTDEIPREAEALFSLLENNPDIELHEIGLNEMSISYIRFHAVKDALVDFKKRSVTPEEALSHLTLLSHWLNDEGNVRLWEDTFPVEPLHDEIAEKLPNALLAPLTMYSVDLQMSFSLPNLSGLKETPPRSLYEASIEQWTQWSEWGERNQQRINGLRELRSKIDSLYRESVVTYLKRLITLSNPERSQSAERISRLFIDSEPDDRTLTAPNIREITAEIQMELMHLEKVLPKRPITIFELDLGFDFKSTPMYDELSRYLK